jgi:hypothetical protein
MVNAHSGEVGAVGRTNRRGNLSSRRSVMAGMKRIGCAVIALGLVACSGSSHHTARPISSSVAPTTAIVKTVEVHGSATISTLSAAMPMRRSAVEASDLHGRVVGTATTDAKGVFSLQLPPGEYKFTIQEGGIARACPTRAKLVKAPGGNEVTVSCPGF